MMRADAAPATDADVIVAEEIDSRVIRSRVWLLGFYAAANLVLGVWLVARQPARADDLWIVYDWCRAWLLHGQQVYAGIEARTDYPPNAIVELAPLAFVPQWLLVPLWTTITLAVTPLYAYLVARTTAPRIGGSALVVVILLFLSWGGTRTFLEFSRVSLTLAFAAVMIADRWPAVGGVALGLALAKPHIAGPVMLWALITRRTRVAATALVVVTTAFAVYCLRVHTQPTTVLVDYLQVLRSLYTGPGALIGRTNLQQWGYSIAGDSTAGYALWATMATLLILVPCALAMRGPRTHDSDRAILALFCLWSLLTIYHIGNNVAVLVLPAFVFLLLLDDPRTRPWRLGVVAIIQIAMMLDVPVHLANLVPEQGLAYVLVRDFDRIVVVVAFAAVAETWRRSSATMVTLPS